MKIREVGIAKARIEGLKVGIITSYTGDATQFKTEIFFRELPKQQDLSVTIICGTSPDTAEEYHSHLIKQFIRLQIYDGDQVIILYSKSNHLLAIGKPESNQWLDVSDDFNVKPFGELNIIITDLTVY